MKYKVITIAAIGAGILLGAAGTAARSYNPMKWIKRPTASEQLATNSKQEKDLSLQLQALLPAHATLKDACTAFKSLEDCVASLHCEQQPEDQIQLPEVGYDGSAARWRREVVRGADEGDVSLQNHSCDETIRGRESRSEECGEERAGGH